MSGINCPWPLALSENCQLDPVVWSIVKKPSSPTNPVIDVTVPLVVRCASTHRVAVHTATMAMRACAVHQAYYDSLPVSGV